MWRNNSLGQKKMEGRIVDPITVTFAALLAGIKGWFLAHGVSIGIGATIGIAKAIARGDDAYDAAVDAGVSSAVAAAFQDFVRSTFGVG